MADQFDLIERFNQRKALRAEWHDICCAMGDGYWRGTEDDALARIEEIKAELAKLGEQA